MRFGFGGAGLRRKAFGSSAPSSIGLTLFGAGVDGFTTSTKTIKSAALVNFQPGMTLGLIYFGFATSGSLLENTIGCGTAPLFTKGWGIDNQFNGAVLRYNSAFKPLTLAGTAFALGLSRFVIVWRASDNHLLVSINGLAFVDTGSLANGTAPDGTSSTFIGELPSESTLTPLVSGSVCAWTILGQELSQAAAQALSTIPLTTSRFSFTAGLAGITPTFDFDAYRDWNGSASSIVTKGSAPITFAVVGPPTLSNYSETRIPTNAAMYSDGKIATVWGGVLLHNAYARLRFTGVSSRSIGYDWFDNFGAFASQGGIAAYSGGTYVGQNQQTISPPSGVSDFILPLGTNRNVDLWEGNQISVAYPTVTGCIVTYVRVPPGSVQLYPAAPQKRLVILGDSIMSGFYPALPFQNSVTALLRADFPTTGTGGVTCHCWGGSTLYHLSDAGGVTTTAATAALIASELDGTVSSALWIQLGINDFGLSVWSAAAFGVGYGAMLDAIHALRPGVAIYCQTPFPTVSPYSEAANPHGNTAGDYRAQVTTAATARSAFCVAVDGSAIYANTTIYNASTAPTGRMYTDGVHNDVAANGTHDIKAYMKTTLAY